MIVVASGGYRTGSTVVFNIARLLMKHKNSHCESGGVSIADIITMQEFRSDYVAKCHNSIGPAGGIKYLHTIRDPFQAILSMKRYYDKHPNGVAVDEFWKRALSRIYHAREVTDTALNSRRDDVAYIPYPFLLSHRCDAIKRIAEFLDIDYDDQLIARICDLTSIDRTESISKKLVDDDLSACHITQYRQDHVSEAKGKDVNWIRGIDIPFSIAGLIDRLY